MVTVLRTPARPNVVRPATCTHGVTYEEPDFAFREGRVRCHRHRIRSDCSRHFARDHHHRERPRQQPEHQVHLDQYLAEVSDGNSTSIKGLGDPGPLLFPPDGDGVKMRKPAAAPVAARKASVAARSRDEAPLEVVCLALVLALLALA